jgi:hypothetical protein
MMNVGRTREYGCRINLECVMPEVSGGSPRIAVGRGCLLDFFCL